MPIPFQDIADHPEDERIRMIGEKVTQELLCVGFMVDDEPGKPERYIRKLQQRFPTIRLLSVEKGPIPGVVTVRVGPLSQ